LNHFRCAQKLVSISAFYYRSTQVRYRYELLSLGVNTCFAVLKLLTVVVTFRRWSLYTYTFFGFTFLTTMTNTVSCISEHYEMTIANLVSL